MMDQEIKLMDQTEVDQLENARGKCISNLAHNKI